MKDLISKYKTEIKKIEFKLSDLIQTVTMLENQLTEKPEKWQVPEYDYYIGENGDVYAVGYPLFVAIGNSFETREIAEQWSKQLKELQLVNALIREKQKEINPDWKPMWNMRSYKYNVCFDLVNEIWVINATQSVVNLGAVPCCEETAQAVVEMLNAGLVEGVER